MLMADQPPYLQPRIRHITSIRVHRLTVTLDEQDALLGQDEHSFSLADTLSDGSQLARHASIEGYDLALPRKPVRRSTKDEQGTGTVEEGINPDINSSQESVESVIDQIVADEGELSSSMNTGNSPYTSEPSRRTAHRDLPNLQFRRNRRRTSQSSSSVVTLRVLQESSELQTQDHNSSALEIPLSPNPTTVAQTRSLSDCQYPTPRILSPSRSGSYTQSPTSPGLGSGMPLLPRRPSLSMNRSRSRLTIPRHVDRDKRWDGQPGGTSPLASPISPSFENGSSPISLTRARTSSPNLGKSSPDLRASPVFEEKDPNDLLDPDDADTRKVEFRDIPSRPDIRSRESEGNVLHASQSVPTTQDDIANVNGNRARSTSISSVRTVALSYNLHSQAFPHAYHGARANHRRERSATIASHYLEPINHTALGPHPEEDSHGMSMLPEEYATEEIPYVDQKILRNRLVRCFVTFSDVESDPDRVTSRTPGQDGIRKSAPKRKDQHDSANGQIERKAIVNGALPTPTSSEMRSIANALTPFYISPIHIRSTHPTFSGLTPRSDYASWLSVRRAASHRVMVEVWVEFEVPSGGEPSRGGDSAVGPEGAAEKHLETRWRRLSHVGGIVDLRRLREIKDMHSDLPENTLIFSFSNLGNRLFYFDLANTIESAANDPNSPATGESSGPTLKSSVQTIMERSLRETKMRKSVGLGELHHMMNLYRVIRDTELDVTRITEDLNARVSASAKFVEKSRSCSKQAKLCNTIQQSLLRIEASNSDTRAHLQARRKALQVRRTALNDAKAKRNMARARKNRLESSVTKLLAATESIQLPIYRHRARAIALIDEIFEISPLDAPSLLYSILKVPLPIPQHPSEPAPPLFLPPSALPRGVKVDEDTISTALGFVAMAVNQISHIWERPLHYPLTCAGSKSLVKDNISIIQGPRSFPLYAKGVEKYRYDYAVFLLNKDIELLMVDAGIKLEDMRHTLPNLKMLLLTLAAHDRPPPT